MKGKKVLAFIGVAALISISFAVNEARTGREAAGNHPGLLDLSSNGNSEGTMGGLKPFQVAFVTRIGSALNEDLIGVAESLRAKRPGKILGDYLEEVRNRRPENPEQPFGRSFADVTDSLDTPKGSLFWEGLLTFAPTLDGVLTSTSTVFGSQGVAMITGGTGKYAGALGTATLAGRIAICPLGSEFCAVSDQPGIPPGLGLRVEYHWVLRGTVPGRDDGDDDDDDGR